MTGKSFSPGPEEGGGGSCYAVAAEGGEEETEEEETEEEEDRPLSLKSGRGARGRTVEIEAAARPIHMSYVSQRG